MKSIFLLLLVCSIWITFSCKKNPDFVTSNDLDPASDNYLVPHLQELELRVIDRQNYNPRIRLNWRFNNGYEDGVYIKKFNPEINDFEFYEKIYRDYREYIDQSSQNTLNPRYLIYTFVDKPNGSVGLSKDSIEVSANFILENFLAEIVTNDSVRLSWEHNYIIDTTKAKISVERLTEGDPNYINRTTLNLSEEIFMDAISSGNRPYKYRIYLQTKLESSDTLVSAPLIPDPIKPTNLKLDSIEEDGIILVTYFPYIFDRFNLSIYDANNRLIPLRHETTVKEDSIYFKVPDISLTSSIYEISLSSILNHNASKALIKTLFGFPELEQLSNFNIDGIPYHPSFNSSTNELIYLEQVESLGFAKYSFDENQSTIIIPPNLDLNQTYYDEKSNSFYGIINEQLKRWNSQGTEIESHPIPDESISQIIINSTHDIALFKVDDYDLLIFDLETDQEVNRFSSGNGELNISANGNFLTVSSEAGYFDLFQISSDGVSFQKRNYPSSRIYDLDFSGSSVFIWNEHETSLMEYSLPAANLINSTFYNVEDLIHFEIIEQRDLFIALKGSSESSELLLIDMNSGSLLFRYNLFDESKISLQDQSRLIYDSGHEKLILVSRSGIHSFKINKKWKIIDD